MILSYELEEQKTNILMIHVAKELDLTESPLGINLIIKSVCDFLNCHAFICLRVHSRTAKKKNQINKNTKDQTL